jgi:circadian clock protein KaiB
MKKSKLKIPDGKRPPAGKSAYHLTLYIAGRSPKSRLAMTNLRQLCDNHLPSRYTVEIVDLVQEPKRARADQIVAIPTLVKKLPPPFKKIIGDLSDSEKVLFGLDLHDESGDVVLSSSRDS